MFKEKDLEIADRIVETQFNETAHELPQPVAPVVPPEVLNLRPKIVQDDDEETEAEDRSANVYSSKLVFKHMVLALGFTMFWAVVLQRLFSLVNPEWIRVEVTNDYVHLVFLPAVKYTLFGALPCLLAFICCSIHPPKKLLKREAMCFSLLMSGVGSLCAVMCGQTVIEHCLIFPAPCVVFGYASILIWKLTRQQVGIDEEELEFRSSKLSIGQRYFLVCLFPFAVGSVFLLMTPTFQYRLIAIVFAIGCCRLSSNRRLKSLIFPSALLAGLLALPLILVETPSMDIGLQSKVYAGAAICIVIFEVLNSINRSRETMEKITADGTSIQVPKPEENR